MINITGQFFGCSGYACHCRYLANALGKITECSLQTNLPPNWEKAVNDLELKMIKTPQDYDINLIITHPLHWRSNMNAKRNWVYLIWEGDTIPKWIVEECMNKDIERILVASTHTANALAKSVEGLVEDWSDEDKILDKVSLIPHGVDLDVFSQVKKDENTPNSHLETRGKPEEDNTDIKTGDADNQPDFKFLANKGLRNLEDRGGLQYLIRAYIEEFTIKDPVELILKINPAYGVPNIPEMFPELKKKDCPKIRVIACEITKEQLNDLYNECDVFVSPTRSEAFNIPVLEAMACGKTIITTNFGGQTDFVPDCNWLIDYDLVPVEHEIEYEGVKWATPKMDKLREALRLSFYNREMAKPDIEKTQKKNIEIAKKLTWDNTASLIKAYI